MVYPTWSGFSHLHVYTLIIVRTGELRAMFSEEDTHSAYLDKFFGENPNTAISWIYDLGKARYVVAVTALLIEAEQAKNLEAKHVIRFFSPNFCAEILSNIHISSCSALENWRIWPSCMRQTSRWTILYLMVRGGISYSLYLLIMHPAFHDDLDFVSVHETLLQEFKSALEAVRGRQSLESQIDIILKAKASTLSEKKALAHVSIVLTLPASF